MEANEQNKQAEENPVGEESLPQEMPEKGENSSLPTTNIEKEPPKVAKKSKKKLWQSLAAVGLAVASFVVGLGASPFFLGEGILTLLRIKNQIQESYYEDISDEEFYSTIFDAISDDLLDPYSTYMTKEEYAANSAQLSGNFAGTGITYTTISGGLYVRAVRGNSPAEEAGLCSGDRIVEYGEDTDEMTAVADLAAYDAFVADQTEPFYLTYERGGARETVVVQNSTFMQNYVFYRTGDLAYGFTGKDAMTLTEIGEPIAGMPQDTAYIRLTKFYGNAPEQFAAAMNLFRQAGKKNLVLDLRSNGGGDMEVLEKICAYFCKGASASPTIAYADNKKGEREYFKAPRSLYDSYFKADSRIYVLADDGTASASECLIGCMSDYGVLPFENICLTAKGGTAKTYGKGIMQTTYCFWLGYTDGIRLTTAKIKWPKSGRSIHGVGVTTADGCVSTDYVFGYDTELLGGLNALGIL